MILSRLNQTRSFFNKTMFVKHVNCLKDNYAYLIFCEKTKQVAAVDPVEPENVLRVMESYPDYKLSMILTTHHHWDHASGNPTLLNKIPFPIPCYGGSSQVDGITNILKGGEKIQLGDLNITALSTTGHTMDHICYYIDDPEQPSVFTGDCLFSSGCGRFFEGTPQNMWDAFTRLLILPDETKVYFGHEYTVSNLNFAQHIEPNNKEIQAKLQWAKQSECTTPSTIANEKLTNPFLRVNLPEVANLIDSNPNASITDILGKLRKMKDNF